MEAALRAGDLAAVASAMGNSLEAPIMAHKPVIAALRDRREDNVEVGRKAMHRQPEPVL